MRTLPIFLAFLVMGVADAMGPMADAVKGNYQLNNVMATLLTFFVFIAFAIFSVPGGVLAARAGKKKVLLLGLGLNAVAVLIPSLMMPSYGLLLGCIFLLGVGTTYLQVAGNPIMRDVSAEGAYARNLSFAQFIKGVGSSASSYLVGLVALLPFLGGMKWRGVFPVFFVLMALAFLAVATLKIDEAPAEAPPSVAGSLALLKEPVFALAVLGIFLYVGAEVCMGRFLKPALSAFGFPEDRAALLGPTLFFAMLTVGRLLGSGLLRVMAPRNAFRLSAALGLLGAALLMLGGPVGVFAGPALAGLGFANIWPLLFALTVEERPGRGAELSGLMCMAISGGAVVPLLMGRLADSGSLRFAFAVPVACFAYLLLLSGKGPREAEA
ncbi:MAG TPA: MFS transporter [Holophagaceae bacterium]|nr:MFS transporter [Holophagaceae bacterium]